jgi:hypothetical protein
MDKYLLTLEEINDIPKFTEGYQGRALVETLEIERHLMLKGIKPFKGFVGGIDFAKGKDCNVIDYNVIKQTK